ncbi:hypothetical protein [Aureimonas sp. AU40]|uniref:hypothetical protein n=1 Tax=Aureimonas sp. AU40 TaxID=1637747 RepID=UPI00078233ED|nr:hypothetical protein [Aureimonas sp. AU40]
MSDTDAQTTLTTAEIEREDILAAAVVEGRGDDPFLEPGDDPNPAPIEEPMTHTAPIAFMLLLVRPRRGEPAFEMIWTEGGGLGQDDLVVPADVPSGYVVCEDAAVRVVGEEKDEQRGIVRRAYGVVGTWRTARLEDFETRPGKWFRVGGLEFPETLRAVFQNGYEQGNRRVVESVKHAIGLDGSEG